ncbi:MAG TPA: DUF4956 domain-containing protein [Polyangia bacterium]|nr:DUF4956 domain-containing protein [Polyangia bacterium]
MDAMLKELERFGDASSAFTLIDVVFVLGLSFLLSMVLAWGYRFTHRGVSYSQSYVHTLVIMGTVVSLIMLVIGSNIARAFALVGALSIVRFRNAMKESRDIGFVFMTLAVGMAVGTKLYLLATFATAMLLVFVIVLYKFNLFSKEVRERILRIQLPVDRDHEAALAEVFREHLEEQRIISLATARAGVLQEVVYSVVLKRKTSPKELIKAILGCNDNQKVTLVLGQQEIDL